MQQQMEPIKKLEIFSENKTLLSARAVTHRESKCRLVNHQIRILTERMEIKYVTPRNKKSPHARLNLCDYSIPTKLEQTQRRQNPERE